MNADHERLQEARRALINTGYFTTDQVGFDIAPRIVELYSALRPNTVKESEPDDTSTADILACFGSERIYHRKIPNEYCGPSCEVCATHPWLIVTTQAGHFKVGWRKRVLSLDWSDTDIKTPAEELFPNEDVTKYDRVIHAWGYGRLVAYLTLLHLQLNPKPDAGP